MRKPLWFLGGFIAAGVMLSGMWWVSRTNDNEPWTWGHHHATSVFPHIGMGLVWIVIIIAVLFLVQRPLGTDVTTRSARRVLDERYVQGDIDKDTYLTMKKTLED